MRIVDWVTGIIFVFEAQSEVYLILLPEFAHRCITSLEGTGDEASNLGQRDQALAAYSIALSLRPSNPDPLLVKWASIMLTCGSVNEALGAAAEVGMLCMVV